MQAPVSPGPPAQRHAYDPDARCHPRASAGTALCRQHVQIPTSSPADPHIQTIRTIARQLVARSELNAAARSFLRLLERPPQDVEALRFVANCQAARGEHTAAMWYLRLAIKLTQDSSAASVQLANVEIAAEDFTEAVSSFVRGLSLALRAFVTRLQSGIALGNWASCARHSSPAPCLTRVPAQRRR